MSEAGAGSDQGMQWNENVLIPGRLGCCRATRAQHLMCFLYPPFPLQQPLSAVL